MAKVRVEWITLGHSGAPDHVQSQVGPATTHLVGPSAQATGPAPAFPAGPGLAARGHARITAIGGPVHVAWATGDTAGEPRGLRVEPGRSILVPVSPGDMLSLLEPPEPSSGQGGAVVTSRSGTVAALSTWQVIAPPDPDRDAFVLAASTSNGAPLRVAESQQAPASVNEGFPAYPGQPASIFPYAPKGRLWVLEGASGTAGDAFAARDVWRRSPLLPAAAAMPYPMSAKMGVLIATRGVGMQQSVRRYHHGVALDLKELYLDLPNWTVSSSAVETANANDIVVYAALEYPVGTTPQPFLVDASYAAVSTSAAASAYGTTGVYIPAGQTARARLAGSFLPASADYYLHLWVAPAAGGALTPGAGVIPAGRFASNASYADKYLEGASVANKTAMTGGETTAVSAPAVLYNPIVAAGTPVDPLRAALIPSFVIWGDSIAYGYADQNNTPTGDTYGNMGPLERWLAGSLGYGVVNLGVPSTRASQWAGLDRGLFPRTVAAVSGMGTHHVIELGVNDFYNATASQVQAPVERIASFWAQRGRRVYATTITPRVASSTDGFATTPNQTTEANNTQRVAYNTTVRAFGLANVTSYIELADLFESARNSGVWKAPGYTADGLHGTSAAYAASTTTLTAAPPFGLVR